MPTEESVKSTQVDSEYFHSTTAKLLYIGKRTRPEILTAISFLSTRVNDCNSDDMVKLQRVIDYLDHTKARGITLKIGNTYNVRAHIDAAYGVHKDGKSHTGCTLTIGERGASYFKSTKQRIITKSSTEAELVALTDSTNVAIAAV